MITARSVAADASGATRAPISSIITRGQRPEGKVPADEAGADARLDACGDGAAARGGGRADRRGAEGADGAARMEPPLPARARGRQRGRAAQPRPLGADRRGTPDVR